MYKHCDGIQRRHFLKAGLFGGLGLSLADLLRQRATATPPRVQGSVQNAIFIYLNGGQSHLDTWDMKPNGGDIAGEFRPIRTNATGFRVCEHMPRLARITEKYAVIRGVQDGIGVHGRGQRLVRSGNQPIASLEHPDLGSVICKERNAPVGVPPFVSLPIRATNSTVETPGYLGVAYRAFSVNEDPNSPTFSVRALQTPTGMSRDRVRSRMTLMQQLDGSFRDVDLANDHLEGMDRFYQQANDILESPSTRQAFDLSHEPSRVRDWYGRSGVGQACLLARRLVESGVRCVTIDFGGWDTHRNNFTSLRDDLLPPWDTALSALLQDLDQRGLLSSTLVWSTGEMGRTPQINNNTGRDHWGRAMSMLLAGGGIRGGTVLGRTDERGAEVTEDGVTAQDVAASALHALGIDPHHEYHTATGRPIQIVRDGNVIRNLF